MNCFRFWKRQMLMDLVDLRNWLNSNKKNNKK